MSPFGLGVREVELRLKKPQPGHRLQLDVKFLERIAGTAKCLDQFTAIFEVPVEARLELGAIIGLDDQPSDDLIDETDG
jgi:hypothetical protein